MTADRSRVPQPVDIDKEALRNAIKAEYKEVAEDPGKGFQFHRGEVFVTSNDGAMWTPLGSGLISATVRSLTVSDRNLFAGTDAGVWRYDF